jgi:dienelactone hydrolase
MTAASRASSFLSTTIVCAALAGCAGGGAGDPRGGSEIAVRDDLDWIPVRDSDGAPRQMIVRICRRSDSASGPVAVINHGSPADLVDRRSMQPAGCASEPARWFMGHGYVVVFPLRRGYGASSGGIAESSGACDSPDYLRAGLESARDVAAAVQFAATLPGARPDGMVVVGQSLGGWATLAYAAAAHPGVQAFISMAGGRGGHAFADTPGNCRPDLLVAAAGAFGRTARTPMLWVYATNDSYFPPALAQAMYAAFTDAGGKADLVQPAFAPAAEGHGLFFAAGGSRVWGPPVAAYLAARPAVPASAL